MTEKLPFWQEVRGTLMLRGTSWKEVVEGLPRRISATEAQPLLQSTDQLAQCNMQGVAFLAGSPIYATPNSEIITQYLPAAAITVEVVVLQWLYQFLILEGLARTLSDTPMADWPPMFLDMYVRGLHFMVYMAALLCLFEEQVIVTDIPRPYFYETELVVQTRVKQTTENLYRKAQDYGESFRRHGVMGLIPRLWDKIARYTQLRSEDRSANFESMQDSARDLLGYSVIAWSLVVEIPAANNIQKVEIER